MIHLMIAAIAVVTTPAPLAPAGKWVVDYRKDMCLVSRPFGPADTATIFALKPAIAMTEGGQTLFVLAPNTGGTGVRRGQATVTPLQSGQQKKFDYVSWVPKGTKLRAYEIEANADFAGSLGEATGVAIDAGKDGFSFATGKLQPVMTALATCNQDLFRSWGIDPTAKASTQHGANPGSWFKDGDYPAAAKRRGAQGQSVVVLTVSGEGRPTACRVVVKADPDLDRVTCELAMRNGRYEASPGKSDRYSILSVRWVLDGY
ncbi:energy transducer TonB [Sphingomonas sp.]|jgi:hypothetical protein|uniref:energy transducer TonB n=1 Tax=Sphingomonas sp. TaxID=28214 RepID=UPI002E319896|nr:energy transducer TonB [Sphingomonas sp.]HEX4693892.1 energy transducer TonB [Sphingomonas sp.]